MITIVILIIIISIILYSRRESFISPQNERIIKRIYDAYIKASVRELEPEPEPDSVIISPPN